MTVTVSYELLSPVSLQTNFENSPAITGLSTGGFLTAGSDPFTFSFPGYPSVTTYYLQAQDYSGSGAVIGGIETSATGYDPSIVQLDHSSFIISGTPNVVIAFEDTGGGVSYRLIDATGADDGSVMSIGDTNSSNPDVAVLNSYTTFSGGFVTVRPGGFVIATEDTFSATDHDIDLRFFNNAGALQRYVTVDASGGTVDSDPQVVQLDNGNVAVTWMRTDGSDTSIRFAVYNRDGTVIVQSSTVLDATGSINRDPAIVATDDGFAVLYQERSTSGSPPFTFSSNSIRMVSLDFDGDVLGARTLVSSSFGQLNDVEAVRLADGLLAFSYTSTSGLVGADSDVLVRVTEQSHTGTVVSAATNVIGLGSEGDDAGSSALAAFGDGRLAVIYHDEDHDVTQGASYSVSRVLTGDGADDVMIGTVLMERFVGGGGEDQVDYSAATSRIAVNLATGVGTEGIATGDTYSAIDHVRGGSGNDDIRGSAGMNVLNGGAGSDFMAGGDGDDVLQGESGADTLYGGLGLDTVIGHAGDDFLYGGGGSSADLRDMIYGGDGNDWADGGYGNDQVNGGNGNDTLSGNFGADTLIGNDGHDVLGGGATSDALFGNAGNDTLNGGFGHDRLNGGTGADRFMHQGVIGHGSDWIQDYSAAQGDVLVFIPSGATAANFQVNYARTPGAGGNAMEAFVIYRPTGQILWALVDGATQGDILVQSGAGPILDLV